MKSLALYKDSDNKLEDLVAKCGPLVKRIAYHLMARLPASVQIDDLLQAGMLGLLEAARRYDPTQGASFTTFAEPRIRGAMFDEIRRGDWIPRSVHRKAREVAAAIRAVEIATGAEARDKDIAEHLGLSMDEYYQTLSDLRGQKLLSIEEVESGDEDDRAEQIAATDRDPSETVQREHLLRYLATAIDGLPERERLVLSLYYDEQLHLKEIGAVLGVSESRVSQLHSQAVARLRARFNSGSRAG